MAKVVQVTLMLEVIDGQVDVERLDWFSVIEKMPEITGFMLTNSEVRPYRCIDDDPSSHTQH